ncbi:MAG: 3-deoxy-7-phosphoheptulonate synthase [Burkholderiales bacterium]
MVPARGERATVDVLQQRNQEINDSGGPKKAARNVFVAARMFDEREAKERAMIVTRQPDAGGSATAVIATKTGTIVRVKGVPIGGNAVQMIAGPCSVETEPQMRAAAAAVAAGGARLMRGGAFKPRTSPYAFQGAGVEGLRLLRESAARHGLGVVTELMDVRMLDAFLQEGVDVIQIGTRNMQNFDLLKEVGRVDVPVILKRGMSATISEWLMAAEYIAAGGNHRIVLCERGIRTFETAYRNVLDVTAIPVLKRETHLPVIVDPSHAGGKAWLVEALACAAVAAGADGLLVEVHPNPPEAWCDADQALTPTEFTRLMQRLGAVATAVGRSMTGAPDGAVAQREGIPLPRAHEHSCRGAL